MIGMKMAHFWHDLGTAFCPRAVIMVLGDKLIESRVIQIKNIVEDRTYTEFKKLECFYGQ